MKAEQISVPLSRELREFVERQAAREDRSVAGQIRHLVAEAARAQAVDAVGGNHADEF